MKCKDCGCELKIPYGFLGTGRCEFCYTKLKVAEQTAEVAYFFSATYDLHGDISALRPTDDVSENLSDLEKVEARAKAAVKHMRRLREISRRGARKTAPENPNDDSPEITWHCLWGTSEDDRYFSS
jgi:hypothetical protein